MTDRRYRYAVHPLAIGWTASIGGMATSEMWALKRKGKPKIFPDEPSALRAAFAALLALIQRDIEVWRYQASQKHKRPSEASKLMRETFGEELVAPRPGQLIPVKRKKRKARCNP